MKQIYITIRAEGKTNYDLNYAIQQASSLIVRGFAAGQDSNPDGRFSFETDNGTGEPREYTDDEKTVIGTRLAEIFKTPISREFEDRYSMGGDYLTKTARGLFEVFMDLAEKIRTGKEPIASVASALDHSGVK